MCTKCHVCNGGCPQIVYLLLLTNMYYHFKSRWSFSLSSNVHAQNTGTQKFLLGKPQQSFDTGLDKKFRKFQYWANKPFL